MDGNYHILSMPRSGSKVLQALLTLGVRFHYGRVCTIAELNQATSLGEFLMFQELRHWAYSKEEETFRSGRFWNLYKGVPDQPFTHYDVERVAAGNYRLAKVDYSYFDAVPESAFRERVEEMTASPIPWVAKSFPAEIALFMNLDKEFILGQLRSLRLSSTTVALMRRNIVDACISYYFMRELDAGTPAQMQERLQDVQANQVSYKISQWHMNYCDRIIRDYLQCLDEVGYDQLIFMEDVIAAPADVTISLLGLEGYSDTLGLRLGLEKITSAGKEASAYFDYPTVVSNYAEVIERLQPAQELINAFAQ